MAAMVEFTVIGIDSLFKRSAKFRAAVAEHPTALREYSQLVGETVKSIAEKNTPVLTGKTRASYNLTVAGAGTHFVVHLSNEAPTFDFLVSGHRAFEEHPSGAYALLVGGQESDLLRMWARIPAQPPNPIMRKTMAEARPLIRIQLAAFKARMVAML